MIRPTTAAVLLGLCTACVRGPSPSMVVLVAFESCKSGNYTQVQRLISKDYFAAANKMGGVRAICEQGNRYKSPYELKIGKTTIHGDAATVVTTYLDENGGEIVRGPVYLVKERGGWRLDVPR